MKPTMKYVIISAVVCLTIVIVDAKDRHMILGRDLVNNDESGSISIIKRVLKGYDEDNNIINRLMKQKKRRVDIKRKKKRGYPPGINKKGDNGGKKQNAPQSLKQQYMMAMESSVQEAQGQTNQNPYRTCLDRFTNRQGGFSYDTIIHTNLQPFTARNERLMSDTIYLSLLQDSTPMNTNSVEQLEEYTLSFLADNIGGRGFEPACVQIMDRSYDTTKVRNNSKGLRKENSKNLFEHDDTNDVDSIESNTLKLQVTYVEKLGPMNRGVGSCSPIGKALCCSQKVINNANRKTMSNYTGMRFRFVRQFEELGIDRRFFRNRQRHIIDGNLRGFRML